MTRRFGGIILDVACRVIVPFSMIYAVYVLVAGEESPGGGFQAGAVLALALVFSRLVRGSAAWYKVAGATAVCIAGVGAFFYVLVGWMTLYRGGKFLQYDTLPFKWLGYGSLHSLGIFLIEAGVTVCVMMTIVDILEALLAREKIEEEETKGD